MAQYWTMPITNPSTGQKMRLIVYAADGASALARARQWIQGNPFHLGATDLNAFLQVFNAGSDWGGGQMTVTPSSTRPPAQGGDTTLDLPSTGTDTNAGGGIGGGIGIPPTTGGGTDVPPDLRMDLDAAAPDSAFRAGLRTRGLNPEGPLGGILGSQFGTAKANFGLKNFYGGEAVPQNSFRDYVASSGPNAYGDALNLYRQAGQPMQQESLSNALHKAGLGDTDEQEAFRGNFMDVARGAARARYSPFSARFLPNETTLNRQFQDQLYAQGERGANAQGVSFLDFLKKQYGF